MKVAVVPAPPVHANPLATVYFTPGDTKDTVNITPALTVSTFTVPRLAPACTIVNIFHTAYHVPPVATVTVFMNHHSISSYNPVARLSFWSLLFLATYTLSSDVIPCGYFPILVSSLTLSIYQFLSTVFPFTSLMFLASGEYERSIVYSHLSCITHLEKIPSNTIGFIPSIYFTY